MTIIRNGRVIRGGVIEAAGEVAFENGKIVPVPADASGAEIIDAAGRYVAPGFVDIHTHGGGGSDFLDNTVEAFLTAARLHAQHGTTTLLPTATSGTPEETVGILAVSKQASEVNIDGADMPGIHLKVRIFRLSSAARRIPKWYALPIRRSMRRSCLCLTVSCGGVPLPNWLAPANLLRRCVLTGCCLPSATAMPSMTRSFRR